MEGRRSYNMLVRNICGTIELFLASLEEEVPFPLEKAPHPGDEEGQLERTLVRASYLNRFISCFFSSSFSASP